MSSFSSYRFIDPAVLAAIGDLPLLANTVVDGFMYGVHASRMPGAGLEFSQYRSYQPGDDLRRIDWKLFGRSDRYFIREAETETSVTVRLVLDASASMTYAEGGVSKLDYARFVAASLAVLARRQGDAVGLYALGGEAPRLVIPPGRGQQHLHRMLHAIETLEAGAEWPEWPRVEGLLAAGGRGITVLLTDLHERGDELRTAARKLSALRHEVVLFHLQGRAERDLDFHGAVRFEELETGRTVDVDADAARAAYREALAAQVKAVRHDLEDRRVAFQPLLLDEPLDAALRAFLDARQRLGPG